MKSTITKSTAAAVALCLVFAATPTHAALSAMELIGAGTVETNCLVALTQGCTISSQARVSGTGIADGELTLRIDTGSPTFLNGNPSATPQGSCVPASFTGHVTTAAGDAIEFNHAGLACEEATPGSPYQYHATFRIVAGTGAFAAAAGNGTLSATFTRWSPERPARAYFFFRGVVEQ